MTLQLPEALKQAFLYGSSIAVMRAVSILVLPFVAHHLSTDEFGRLEVINTLAIIGSVLVGMGLDHTLFRFVGACQNLAQRRRLASEIFSLALIIGGAAWLVGWYCAVFIANWAPGNLTPYELRLVISILALEGCIAVPLGWLRMQNRAKSFFIAATGRALIQASLVVMLLGAGRGVAGVLEAGLLAAIVQALLLGYLQIRDTGLRFSRSTGIQALIYSLPIVGSGLVAFSLNGLDRWLLAEHTSLDDVAQFGVAAKFALAVVLLMQPFSMWWTPRRFEVLKGPEGPQKVAHIASLGIALALIIAVLVGLVSPLLIVWLMPDAYATSCQYVVALVMIMLLREITELVNLGCFIGKTTGTQFLINTLAAGIGVITMLLWIPVFAVWGVIYALLLAQLVRLILFFTFSQHQLPLPYPARSLMLLATISLGWLALGSLTTSVAQQMFTSMTATASLMAIAVLLRLIPVPAVIVTR